MDTNNTVTVSVVIPTRNSASHIVRAIDSVRGQTSSTLECIVVDSCSSDGTASLARESGATVVVADSSMTRARLIGANLARGDYILNLDSDQILLPTSVKQAIETRADIVALGETSAGTGLVWRLTSMDREAISVDWRANLDPVRGAVRPRMYRRELLLRSLRNIPDSIIDLRPCPYSEDSLIYLGAYSGCERVAFVPDAVIHSEMEQLVPFLKKWSRYGVAARAYRGTKYEFLVRARGGLSSRGTKAIRSVPSLLLRGIPFAAGYFFGR